MDSNWWRAGFGLRVSTKWSIELAACSHAILNLQHTNRIQVNVYFLALLVDKQVPFWCSGGAVRCISNKNTVVRDG